MLTPQRPDARSSGLVAWISRHKLATGIIAAVALFILVGSLVDDQPSPVAAKSLDSPSSTSESPVPSPSPDEVALPNVRGESVQSASDELEELGLLVVTEREFSRKPGGTVLRVTPAPGGSVVEGATITLLVAAPYPAIPGVIGRSLGSARSILREAGYEVRVVKEVSSQPPGTVIRMSPTAHASRLPGTRVTIVVAKSAPESPGGDDCTPGYSPCLPPASDYDCAGGSGNGPEYAYGVITVTGSDPYGLDSDNDGYGCET